MLVLSIIATVLLAINIFCLLIGMIEKVELGMAVIYDIFALVTIWILYAH